MRGPAVSGAGTYRELCIAARNEEKRLASLKEARVRSALHWYHTTFTSPTRTMQEIRSSDSPRPRTTGSPVTTPQCGGRTNRKCFYCGKQGHRKADCRQNAEIWSESRGPSRSAMMKQICTRQGNKYSSPRDTPPSGTEVNHSIPHCQCLPQQLAPLVKVKASWTHLIVVVIPVCCRYHHHGWQVVCPCCCCSEASKAQLQEARPTSTEL